MIRAFEAINSYRLNNKSNGKLDDTVKNYLYLYVVNNLKCESSLIKNIAESSVIMINHYEDKSMKNEELLFIIVFRKTVLIVKKTILKNLKQLFQTKNEMKICFFEDTKSIFDENIKIKYDELEKNENFTEEISAISNEFFNFRQIKYKEFLDNIKICISGYLIQQSYCDLKYDRIKYFYSKTTKEIIPREFNENEIIELRIIGTGSSFQAVLHYHIPDEKLCIIKKPITSDTEIEKLLGREQYNYTKIKHPLIPKYYGTTKVGNEICIVVEYINGRLLSEIDCSQFSVSEKIKIIIQLLSVINYLHDNHFIYRDMKPNNVIINENQTAVVIDFDLMIEDKNSMNENNNPQTTDFIKYFQAPEINDRNLTNKCDVYSIGQMIKEIIPNIENDEYYSMIYSIYKKCTDKTPTNRPSISNIYYVFFIFITNKNISIDLSLDFYHLSPEELLNLGLIYEKGRYIPRDINKSIFYYSLAANKNHPRAQYNLGVIYYKGQYIPRDINKSIYYYSLAANQNIPEAQFILGLIYYKGQYISRNINKSIYYFSLAANQNISEAQYNLGIIYYEGQYVSRDINKSIYFYSLAANQNNVEAQYNLGVIYYEGQYISRDINKSIYYYSLAADQNNADAQYNLGLIYKNGRYILQDINKSIYYFSLAANQNHPEAQFNLGLIYEEGQNIPQDINKSIYFYSLAANQNYPDALYNLGLIYEEGQYILRDINKAIYYYSLAANQNHPEAQYNLGVIYYEGQYITRDLNKSIYYYSLAANQNIPEAQYNLGIIYEEGQNIPQDINKSIYFYSLAANQNYPDALYNLGIIYYKGQYIPRDIKKSFNYFSLAANLNNANAQFILGLIYYGGQYISRDINKSIYYYSLAANQNHPKAQFILGLIYYLGQDIKRGINWITQSSNNNCNEAHIAFGFLYQEGKYMKRNIEESIKYYKKASSFNNQYAKNNLGIIYKNYFEKKYDYTVYFEEAIRQKNDPVSMYNLSHAYIYEYQDEKLINKSIELLIKSSNLGFIPSTKLLCMIILKIYFDKQTNDKELINNSNIEQVLSKFTKETSELKNSFINIIQKHQLYSRSIFEYYYEKYKEIEFVYNLFLNPICIKEIYKEENELKQQYSNEKYNITIDFYEGFGQDIYQKQ